MGFTVSPVLWLSSLVGWAENCIQQWVRLQIRFPEQALREPTPKPERFCLWPEPKLTHASFLALLCRLSALRAGLSAQVLMGYLAFQVSRQAFWLDRPGSFSAWWVGIFSAPLRGGPAPSSLPGFPNQTRLSGEKWIISPDCVEGGNTPYPALCIINCAFCTLFKHWTGTLACFSVQMEPGVTLSSELDYDSAPLPRWEHIRLQGWLGISAPCQVPWSDCATSLVLHMSKDTGLDNYLGAADRNSVCQDLNAGCCKPIPTSLLQVPSG